MEVRLILILQTFWTRRGSELIRRSSQGGPRADSETEERPIRAKENGRVGGLDELDNQLSSLSSSDNSIPNAKKTSQGTHTSKYFS